MNNHTSLVVLAVIAIFSTLTISSVYGQACVGCETEIAKLAANQMLPIDIAIIVWTDNTAYDRGDKITVYGKVANVSGFPVTLTVTSPLHSVVTIAQLNVNKDGTFGIALNTGGETWKHKGTYTIKVNYGTATKSNKAFVELSDTITTSSSTCGPSEIDVKGKCLPFTISNGKVIGASVNTNDKSIVISISADQDGELTVTPEKSIIDGIFMVLVDGEEWDDVTISDGKVIVMFPAGTEKIEVIGTSVIPEFGAIAAMILAVAIISIIVVSAKSRLIMPRY